MLNPFETEKPAAFKTMCANSWKARLTWHIEEWDEAGGYPHEVNEKVCELVFFGFDIPEEYGGLGFDDMHMRKAVGLENGAFFCR